MSKRPHDTTPLNSRTKTLLIYLIKLVRESINSSSEICSSEYESVKYKYNPKTTLRNLRSISDKKYYYKHQQTLLNNLRSFYSDELIQIYSKKK